jgi:hypothetical protein
MKPVPNRAPKFDPATSTHEIQLKVGKGKFKTVRTYKGNGLDAVRAYKALNISRDTAKRFVVDGNVTHRTNYDPLGE